MILVGLIVDFSTMYGRIPLRLDHRNCEYNYGRGLDSNPPSGCCPASDLQDEESPLSPSFWLGDFCHGRNESKDTFHHWGECCKSYILVYDW